MNSSILNSIGLGNLDIGLVIIILLAVIVVLVVITIINLMNINKLKKKYAFFMKGRNAKSLENEIFKMFEENEKIKSDIEKDQRNIKALNKQIHTTFQKMGLVKYDAFDQMGGKLSFCLALLDEDDNGFLLNSVHSTDSSYSYIKRIEKGQCNMDLGNEEQAALTRAKQGEMNEAG